MRTKKLLLTLIIIICSSIFPEDDLIKKGLNSITPETVKAQLDFLASDWMEGREAGTKGNFMAGDYIASMLEVYGIKPAGDLNWKNISREDRRAGKKPESDTNLFSEF